MAIEFHCEGCGRRLRAAEERAGRRSRCPVCGAAAIVPAPAAPLMDEGPAPAALHEQSAAAAAVPEPCAPALSVPELCTPAQYSLEPSASQPPASAELVTDWSDVAARATEPVASATSAFAAPAGELSDSDAATVEPLPPYASAFAAPAGESSHPASALMPEEPEPADADNPFAAPRHDGAYAIAEADEDEAGPAWERDGASLASFLRTLRELFGRTGHTFRTMRRSGKLALPLVFALIGNLAGALASAISTYITLRFGLYGMRVQPLMLDPEDFLLSIVLYPVYVVASLFVFAGIYHVMLMLVGGANHGYPTTFRVIAYSSGAASTLMVIPLIAHVTGPVAGLVWTVMTIVGASRAHGTSGGNAALAFYLPVLIGCGVGVGVLALTIR
jgi:DNA-directed RNA polymerase subunit RPC12/RpoP